MKITFKSTDRWFIEVDQYGNHTLCETTVSESGKERIKYHGHYSSVIRAVQTLSRLNVLKQFEVLEVMEYMDKLNSEYNRLMKETE